MTPETIVEACVRLSGACDQCDDTGRMVLCHDPDCQQQNACHHVGGEVPCDCEDNV